MGLMVWVLFAILIFAGCGSAPASGLATDASTSLDAPSSMAPFPPVATPLSSSVTELTSPAWEDLSLRAGSGSASDGGVAHPPFGRTLDATTCGEPSLHLASELERYARDGYELWQLCYRTPTPQTSPDVRASSQPESMVISVVHEPSRTLREVLAVPRSSFDRTQTASILLVLPPQTRPFFFLENRYGSRGSLGAVSESEETGDPISHGELLLWRLQADGSREASVPGVGVVCALTTPTREASRILFFVPHLACLGGFESCRLNRYDCRDLLSLPL